MQSVHELLWFFALFNLIGFDLVDFQDLERAKFDLRKL